MIDVIKKLVPYRFSSNKLEIPVVRLQGTIMDSSTSISRTLSLSRYANLLEKAFAYKKAPAIVLIINSPGGSPVQSRLIFKRIRDLAEEKIKRFLYLLKI